MRVLIVYKKTLRRLAFTLAMLLIGAGLLKYCACDQCLKTSSLNLGKLIVIDAGHGGFDPGALAADGTREDEICLSIAQKLEAILKRNGFDVVMTRSGNQALGKRKSEDMQKRLSVISNSNAVAVISIHLNAFGNPRYFGTQTFYRRESPTSQDLAQCIQGHIQNALLPGNKRTIMPADDFAVLNATSAAAVIVECGFLSNVNEAEMLKDENYQLILAKGIGNGIVSYFEMIE